MSWGVAGRMGNEMASIKLTFNKADAETARKTLQALVAIAAPNNGIGNKVCRLAGWSGHLEAEYIATLVRIAAYIETVERSTGTDDA